MSPIIPEVDFSQFLTGSTKDREHIAVEIDNALRTVGFFHLRNHGISQSIIDASFESSKRFHDLPDRTKISLRPTSQSSGHGYFAVGTQKTRGQACVKASFDFGNPEDDSSGPWPANDQLLGFRDCSTAFYKACSLLISQLLKCLSVALGLGPTDSLCQYHNGSMFHASLIHYPAVLVEQIRSGGVVRNPAHSDLGILTLLFQRNVGGLQVADMSSTNMTSSIDVDKNGKFLDVEPNPGTILVNVGYLLMRWTNGRWKNTVHRVLEPPPDVDLTTGEDSVPEMIPERYSIAFFSFPDADTIVQPLASCCSDVSPERWKPLRAGDYLLKKRAHIFS